MARLLSICIPTYNRVAELEELIDSLLSLDGDDFEIVITDNQSTDETKNMILGKKDHRLVYYYNENPLPAYLNMIHSIFNARGKYALYCNDRDILLPDRVEKLTRLLKNEEYAFLISPCFGPNNDESLQEFPSGFESLMKQDLIHHPTGMVYNRELIEKHLKKEKYEKYLDSLSIYDFLMVDLFKFGKTAIYNCGYWKQRGPEYLALHKSGGKLYFTPDVRNIMFYSLMDYIIVDNDFSLDQKQKQLFLNHIYLFFCFLFSKYKMSMADKYETAHYGINTKHISTAKMLMIYKQVFTKSISHLQEKGYSSDLIDYIKKKKNRYYFEVLKVCFEYDLRQLKKKFKSLLETNDANCM